MPSLINESWILLFPTTSVNMHVTLIHSIMSIKNGFSFTIIEWQATSTTSVHGSYEIMDIDMDMDMDLDSDTIRWIQLQSFWNLSSQYG